MRPQSCLLPAVVIAVFSIMNDNNNYCSAFSFDKNPITAASLSQTAVTKAANNQFMSVPTRRDTIKMPSQTPMVPWTVRFYTFKTLAVLHFDFVVLYYNKIKTKSIISYIFANISAFYAYF